MGVAAFNVLDLRKPAARARAAFLDRHASPSPRVADAVRAIVEKVRADGDKALLELTAKFDKVRLKAGHLRLRRPPAAPPPAVVRAVRYALANVERFAKAGLPRDWEIRNREGARVGEQYRPLERVGIYVPGGTAPLVSTSIMTAGIARVAGVKEIAVVTPPPVDANLHYALRAAGATEIYQVGGAQAVAALAFGTRTIRRVQKIFGPGNAYVVEAKRQVLGAVAIDQLPGPSEIAVLADDTAEPSYVAADLLAQAEHGPGSQFLFVTASDRLLKAVQAQIQAQLPRLARQQHLQAVLAEGAAFVRARTLAEGIAVVEAYAPEHLSLVVRNARAVARRIRNAGAIFLGNFSPVAAGDFVAGPSHTLPTGGAAKSFPGLTVDQFFRRTSVVEYTRATLAPVVPVIETFSAIEHLDAHGRSARLRLEG